MRSCFSSAVVCSLLVPLSSGSPTLGAGRIDHLLTDSSADDGDDRNRPLNLALF